MHNFYFDVKEIMKTKKQLGYEGEALALEHYQSTGYQILETNYTIPGGEIDIIAQKDDEIAFVEVKVVNYADDLHGYVSPRKMGFLDRCIQSYMSTRDFDYPVRLDIVFVKDKQIIKVIENATNT